MQKEHKELLNYRLEQIFTVLLGINMLFGVIGAVMFAYYLIQYLIEQNYNNAKNVADSVLILIASGLPAALSFKIHDGWKLRLLNIAGLIFNIIFITVNYVPGN